VSRRKTARDSGFDDHKGFRRPHDGIQFGRFGHDVVNVPAAALEVFLKFTVTG
jgi:hypothetical protein